MLRKLRLRQKKWFSYQKTCIEKVKFSTNRRSDPCIVVCTFKTYYLERDLNIAPFKTYLVVQTASRNTNKYKELHC